MAWPSGSINITNMDAGTDSVALARADIKAAADALNIIINNRGVSVGVAPTDASNRVPLVHLPTIPANQGGTGQTGYVVGDILIANSASTLARLPAGAAGFVLKSNGPGQAVSWQQEAVTVGGSRLAGRFDPSPGPLQDISVGVGLNLSAAGVLSNSAIGGAKGMRYQIYTSSGFWTVPDGVTEAVVLLIGGGGGGSFAGTNILGFGAPGQAAGFSIVNLTPNASVPVTVGVGGSGHVNGAVANGGAGGATLFGGFASALGGNGGVYGQVNGAGGHPTLGLMQFLSRFTYGSAGQGSQVQNGYYPGTSGVAVVIW